MQKTIRYAQFLEISANSWPMMPYLFSFDTWASCRGKNKGLTFCFVGNRSVLSWCGPSGPNGLKFQTFKFFCTFEGSGYIYIYDACYMNISEKTIWKKKRKQNNQQWDLQYFHLLWIIYMTWNSANCFNPSPRQIGSNGFSQRLLCCPGEAAKGWSWAPTNLSMSFQEIPWRHIPKGMKLEMTHLFS